MKGTRRSIYLAAACLAGSFILSCSGPQPVALAGWSPLRAARYLDQREDWWVSWKGAKRDHDTFCVSCHTVLPYALSRRAVGVSLRESALPSQETRLVQDVTKRTELWNQTGPYYASKPGAPNLTTQSRGTESVINALVLAAHDTETGHLSRTTRSAFINMWSTQLTDGPDAGSWAWLNFGLEPWEAPESQYFGAALGLLAVNIAPEAYRYDSAIQKNLSRLREYLSRDYSTQSLLNRIALLWAAGSDLSVLDAAHRRAIISDLLGAQRSDGSWSLATLIRGRLFVDPHRYLRTWVNSSGFVDQSSDGYATGLAVISLLGAETSHHDPVIQRGISWLMRHQDASGGFWPARSLNERRDPDSVGRNFMTDASTAFASLALVQAAQSADDGASRVARRDGYPLK